jgi:DNA-directed RNA polymerase specialized sigma24 family protein
LRPLTHLQALMEEVPGASTGIRPIEETLLLKEALAEAFDQLTPEDRWIAERLLIEGLSLRKTGAVLGIPKTTLARRRDKICLRLVDVLVDSPAVREWMRN